MISKRLRIRHGLLLQGGIDARDEPLVTAAIATTAAVISFFYMLSSRSAAIVAVMLDGPIASSHSCERLRVINDCTSMSAFVRVGALGAGIGRGAGGQRQLPFEAIASTGATAGACAASIACTERHAHDPV